MGTRGNTPEENVTSASLRKKAGIKPILRTGLFTKRKVSA